MKCHDCRGRNPDNADFCLHCGARFTIPRDNSEKEVRPYKLGATTIGGIILAVVVLIVMWKWTDIWYTRHVQCQQQISTKFISETCKEFYAPRFRFVPPKQPKPISPHLAPLAPSDPTP